MKSRAIWKGVSALIVVMLVAAAVFAATQSMTGVISSRPETGAPDADWVIGDTTFRATSVTQFDESQAALEEGGCAEVSYFVDNGGINQALMIAGRTADQCD